MKKDEVHIGSIYRTKVNQKMVDVRIERINDGGGWDATNLATNKEVHLKSARHLSSPSTDAKATQKPSAHSANHDANDATVSHEVKPDGDTLKGPTSKATRAKRRDDKRTSALDAAAQILQHSDEPMRVRAMITAMADQGLWTSPSGKTHHATLYAAIIREIASKGDTSRFQKIDSGLFVYSG